MRIANIRPRAEQSKRRLCPCPNRVNRLRRGSSRNRALPPSPDPDMFPDGCTPAAASLRRGRVQRRPRSPTPRRGRPPWSPARGGPRPGRPGTCRRGARPRRGRSSRRRSCRPAPWCSWPPTEPQTVDGTWGETYPYPVTPHPLPPMTGADTFEGTALAPSWSCSTAPGWRTATGPGWRCCGTPPPESTSRGRTASAGW